MLGGIHIATSSLEAWLLITLGKTAKLAANASSLCDHLVSH